MKRPTAAETLILTLHYLPDTSVTSGNARHGHWAQRYKAMRSEREIWALELYLALNVLPGRSPRYKRLTVKPTLIYLTKRRRDQDNALAALKPLFDTMVDFGLVPDDDAEHLTIELPVLLVDRARGPVTVLELKGER